MTDSIPLAIVGVGKIALDQHVPTIAASTAFALAATVTRGAGLDDVPNYRSLAEMMATHPDVRAVSICTPPRDRLALVREAVRLGLDILLEKPPAATLGEAQAIVDLPAASDRTLYLTWHSRMAAGVGPARRWLADRQVRRVAVTWKENVRTWHPGQEWIWEPGIGVFDPGINALSVVTALFIEPLRVEKAALRYPANKQAPIAADLRLVGLDAAPIDVAFDFDQRGRQSWTIEVETDDGTLLLKDGAATAAVDGEPLMVDNTSEYARLYRRFAELIAARRSDADLAPLRLVADAFMVGERQTVEAFSWD